MKRKTVQGDLNGLLSNFLIKQRQNTVKPYLDKKRNILDLGCGVFRWNNLLQPATSYTGVDIELDIISFNKKHYPEYSFYQKNLDKEELSLPQNNFDFVIMLAVLEHLEKPVKVLNEVRKTLQDDGIIILTTPHPRGENVLEIGSKVRIFSQDKHQHQPLFNREKIQDIAEQAKLKIVEFQTFLLGFNQKIILSKE
jgi:2-polyprenyl-3-methyl-5-hydroxy-6-metoxy-1,4-benzoquinol methylase